MSILLSAGVFAIILGLFFMILGGTGHSNYIRPLLCPVK